MQLTFDTLFTQAEETYFSRIMQDDWTSVLSKATRYFQRKGYRGDTADELAQQTMIKVWDAIEKRKYKDSGTFSQFLSRVSFNVLVDYSRKTKRQRIVAGSDALDSTPIATESLDADIVSELAAALKILNETERAIYIDRHYRGMTNADIAKKHGESNGFIVAQLKAAQSKFDAHFQS